MSAFTTALYCRPELSRAARRSRRDLGFQHLKSCFFNRKSNLQRLLNDLENLPAHVLQGGGVNINPINAVGERAKIQLLLQPYGKIVGVQLQPQPRLNKVVMNA